MSDYSKMTDDELRKKIAKAKGMSFRQSDGWTSNRKYILATPYWPASIADAWELVEDLNLPQYCIDIWHDDGGWHCGLHNDKGGYLLIDSSTAPRAICEAWLAWKEAQE